MDEHKPAHAQVRFYGSSLDPLDVTIALRMPYDHVHRAGEPRLGRRPPSFEVHEYDPHRSGMWNMSSRKWVDSPNLDEHVRWLLDQLEERREAVDGLLGGDVKADIFCYSEGPDPEPPALPKETTTRADALGMEIIIDHYSD